MFKICVHETQMPPAATKTKFAIINIKATVNVTRSLSLVSFERVSFVAYAFKSPYSSLINSQCVIERCMAPAWNARGRWFDSNWIHILSFSIFRLFPVPYSSAKPIRTDANPAGYNFFHFGFGCLLPNHHTVIGAERQIERGIFFFEMTVVYMRVF